MINVTYKRAYLPHKNIWYRLEAEGHADYADKGKDIVCAGASALMYTLANYLEQIGADDLMGSDDDDFFVECKGLYHDEAVHTAFRMTVFGLSLLQEQYPDYISVTEEPDDVDGGV
jgi:uncharacterized protein YsxB (DUF464 family)